MAGIEKVAVRNSSLCAVQESGTLFFSDRSAIGIYSSLFGNYGEGSIWDRAIRTKTYMSQGMVRQEPGGEGVCERYARQTLPGLIFTTPLSVKHCIKL